MAHLMTPDPTPSNLRAILFVQGGAGADLTVRNLELSGAVGPYANGAGILFEIGNGNLTIQNSWFHDNQDGVLVGNQPAGQVTIDRSEFNNNGVTDPANPRYGFSHNLYVNEVANLTITNSYFHDAVGGHEIKSRADVTVITGNRIQDGPTANASYDIDLPNGGLATINGNVIEKGDNASNRYAVHFGGEFNAGPTSYDGSLLTLQDNILINDRAGATALLNQTLDASGKGFPVTVTGNTLYGFDGLYETANPPSAADYFANNQMLTTGAPPLDTAHPFETAEPASGAVLGLAMLAAAIVRRRRVSSGRSSRG
jgi:MYXO-CTERM domain-containing protein